MKRKTLIRVSQASLIWELPAVNAMLCTSFFLHQLKESDLGLSGKAGRLFDETGHRQREILHSANRKSEELYSL